MTIIFFILTLMSIPIAVKSPVRSDELKFYSPLEHPVQRTGLLDILSNVPLFCARVIYLLSGIYLICMIRYGVEGNIDKMSYTANCMMVTFIVASLVKHVSQSERLR